jgi:hypothetical protein
MKGYPSDDGVGKMGSCARTKVHHPFKPNHRARSLAVRNERWFIRETEQILSNLHSTAESTCSEGCSEIHPLSIRSLNCRGLQSRFMGNRGVNLGPINLGASANGVTESSRGCSGGHYSRLWLFLCSSGFVLFLAYLDFPGLGFR